ncbi:MAG: hypothetical protein KCHDKBKB_02161 [Elusimicrobia bacterium]|nr:hypothetical protein [Elusimicrobiota bacterium]
MNTTRTSAIHALMLLTLLTLGAGQIGCKKKSSNNTSSGGGTHPSQQNPYTGNPGNLAGSWTGKNSSGGDFRFTVNNGFIDGFSNSWLNSAAAQNMNTSFTAQSYKLGIPIDPSTGKFDGYLESVHLKGTFLSDDSASGAISAVDSSSNLPELSWTAKLTSGRPDNYKVRIDISKLGSMGVIDTNTGIRICEENEYRCNADFSPGAQLTLTASTLSPLYTFTGWGSNNACSSFGTSSCQLTLNSSIDFSLYGSFNEINVDGTYTGTTEQGKAVTLTIVNNVVTITSQVKMGSSNCVFNVAETDDYDLFYVSDKKALLFYMNKTPQLTAWGFYTSPTAISGTIFFDSNKVAGTASGCLGSGYIDYSIGGSASAAAMSTMSMHNHEADISRLAQLDRAARSRR